MSYSTINPQASWSSVTRAESTVLPAPLTIRKVKQAGQYYLYLYVRANAATKQVEGLDGELQALYEYDEIQACMPLPADLPVNVSASRHHAENQDKLKADFLDIMTAGEDAEVPGDKPWRTVLASLVAKDETAVYAVDRLDWLDVFANKGELVSLFAKKKNWAEPLRISQ